MMQRHRLIPSWPFFLYCFFGGSGDRELGIRYGKVLFISIEICFMQISMYLYAMFAFFVLLATLLHPYSFISQIYICLYKYSHNEKNIYLIESSMPYKLGKRPTI